MMEGSALDLATNIGMMNRGRDGDDDGFGGGWGIWILIILFFIMGNRGGLGGFGGGAVETLTNEFLYTNLNNTLDRGFNQIANQNFGLQKDLCQGFNSTQMEIANSRFAAQECCCETNRNIDAVRYENSRNTCDIITAANANTQRIIDKLNDTEVQNLRDQNLQYSLQLSQQAQSANLIATLRPTPIPAYMTCSPYFAYNNGAGCGGCGCGNI